jgi:hypothetical protein
VELRPRPQWLVGFGGFAAKTNQKTSRGGFAAPNPIPAYAGTEANGAIRHNCTAKIIPICYTTYATPFSF